MVAYRFPFNQPDTVGREYQYLTEAVQSRVLSAGGEFSRRCEARLGEMVGSARAILTHTCTDALEMAALLAGVGPGDEVIMPSFTFVSTATAVVLRGGVPVFVDIDPVSLNLDPSKVEAAISKATKAVVMVHYAAVGTGVDQVAAICERHGLMLIEDAAHAVGASYEGRPLGSYGALSTLSFHETKNVTCGEGGALLVNDRSLVGRAEIIADKGTDRARFERGETQKYVWQDVGSSFRASELAAAFLLAQIEQIDEIRDRRLRVWSQYQAELAPLERDGHLLRPRVPQSCDINGHIYYVLLPDEARRARVIEGLTRRGVQAVFHYVPLHDSPAGHRYGRTVGAMTNTVSIASRILRLPVHLSLTDDSVGAIATAVRQSVLED